MKLSNFVMIGRIGKKPIDFRYIAEIDVTTGILWWKKTERRKISRSDSGVWFFIGTRESIPDHEMPNS